MKNKELYIAEPCHESWDKMEGKDATRFCGQCDKNVHNLSGMTKREADELLATQAGLCVRYSSTQQGDVLFRDSQDPAWRLSLQKQGARRMAQAALLALPLALSACIPKDSPVVEVVSPLVVEDGKFVEVGVLSTPPTTTEGEACDSESEPKPEQLVSMDEPDKGKDKVKLDTDHRIMMGRRAVPITVEIKPNPKPKAKDVKDVKDVKDGKDVKDVKKSKMPKLFNAPFKVVQGQRYHHK